METAGSFLAAKDPHQLLLHFFLLGLLLNLLVLHCLIIEGRPSDRCFAVFHIARSIVGLSRGFSGRVGTSEAEVTVVR